MITELQTDGKTYWNNNVICTIRGLREGWEEGIYTSAKHHIFIIEVGISNILYYVSGLAGIHHASMSGHIEVLRLLLTDSNVDINLQTNDGKFINITITFALEKNALIIFVAISQFKGTIFFLYL